MAARAVDVCPLSVDADQADGDEDGRGDACDPCTNLFDVGASKAQLKLTQQHTPPGDDGMLLKGTLEGLPTEPPLDPATHGMRILLEGLDSALGAFVDTVIPGGDGWKVNKKGTAARWKGAVSVDGIQKVSLKSSSKRPDRVKFVVSGKDGTFTLLPDQLPVTATVTFTTPLAAGGECGEVTFLGAACGLNRKETTLSCR